jgi:phage/plasmid-like protein (TIGR03299 family)
MSHEITASDGMFTVRLAAWHGLGTVFEDYPKREEAQAIAHPWDVVEEPLFRKIKADSNGIETVVDGDGVDYDRLEQVKGFKANVRSDNDMTLGVVTEKFTNVTNHELWDVAESLERSGADVMFETGGSLKGGRNVWVLLRLQEPLVVKGDPRGETIPYYALQNSFDGSGAFRGQATMTRIVCANTARVADMDAKARGTEFTFRHSTNVGERVEEARIALAQWRESLTAWQAQAEALVERKLPEMSASAFLDRFIPVPPANLVTERVMQNVIKDRSKWLEAYNGVTGEGLRDTAYGLVQASVEFLEWGRKAFTAESRFQRSFLSKNDLVTHAVNLAMEAPLR